MPFRHQSEQLPYLLQVLCAHHQLRPRPFLARDHILKRCLALDPDLASHDVHSFVIDTPEQSAAAVARLLTPPTAPGPYASRLARAGVLALDLEGRLADAAKVDIHSVQIAVPMAPRVMDVAVPSFFTAPAAAPSEPPSFPVEVYYWRLDKMPELATRHACMDHVAALLADTPGILKILHAGYSDAYALMRQFDIDLGAFVLDTQVAYDHWRALSDRVLALYQHVAGKTPTTSAPLPPLRTDFVHPKSNPRGASTTGVGDSMAMVAPLMAVDGTNLGQAGLNDVYAACRFPTNDLKSRTARSDAAQTRYAVRDVAYLCQAARHMQTAIAYLAHWAVMLDSHGLLRSLLPANADDASSASTASSADPNGSVVSADVPLVWAMATVLHAKGPTMAVPDLAEELRLALGSTGRTALSKRVGGVRQIAVDYPRVFRFLRAHPYAIDPAGGAGAVGTAARVELAVSIETVRNMLKPAVDMNAVLADL
ncbi:hypothetical protein AMAG_04237 [Allomyces macrogynus ATCC 38327]|uniref:3'-5' exonuclease domain-containing protein n=1 Tax=Allomyces macrogynus (strain ATCC 38327) TaxID=578462 RepID=A0A0L0S7V7_ALLM3|nr:hypothetical protein AMAG_04237 [Allomyces macrogynus ATCC 38327]|eukprot:KNE58683.1 hypothetical protein AMAG_04237 [Allomyces macrogynus ATCC 38327]